MSILVLWLLSGLAQQVDTVISPRSAFVQVNGVRVHYLDWGGSGEPLILVPARCDTPFVFGDLAPLLVMRYRVMGVTARGCGESGPASDGYDVDLQIRELIGFLVSVGTVGGGGTVVRLAQQHPTRVSRLVTFDIIYAGVPDEFESTFGSALALPKASLSLESYRREFEAWELGTWSAALEQDFRGRTERAPDGSLRFRRSPPEWQRAFVDDVTEKRYHGTAVTHPALFLVADDLDRARVRRLEPTWRRQLAPMADLIARARRDQLAAYQKNGPHARVVPVRGASHYLFVDRATDVANEMLRLLGPPPP